MKVHFRDIRLRNNAGFDFPLCYAGAKLLDTEKGRLATSGDINLVTCRHCISMHPKRYSWANQRRRKL